MKNDWFRSCHRVFFISANRRVISMIALYMIYLCLGAIVFAVFEHIGKSGKVKNQDLTSTKLIRKMVETLRNHNFSDNEITESFAQKHYEWQYESNEYSGSFFDSYAKYITFGLLLIGAVGYGHVMPKTNLGKFATILFLLVGRPFQTVMMRLLGIEFRSGLRTVLNKASELSLKLPEIFHHSKVILFLTGTMFFFFFSVCFMLGPAAIFEKLEGWSYREGFYFSFLSLSGITFGDYVASISVHYQNSKLFPMFFILIIVWLVFGTAFLKMVANLMSFFYGLFILDKMDGKSKKRAEAREKLSNLYNKVSEISWKLTKYCPTEFTKERVFQDFLDMCADYPEEITEENMRLVFEASEELKAVVGNRLLQMNLPEELKADTSFIRSTTNSDSSAALREESILRMLREHSSNRDTRGVGRISYSQEGKSLPALQKLSVFQSSEVLPTISDKILMKKLSESSGSKNETVSEGQSSSSANSKNDSTTASEDTQQEKQ